MPFVFFACVRVKLFDRTNVLVSSRHMKNLDYVKGHFLVQFVDEKEKIESSLLIESLGTYPLNSISSCMQM